MTRLVLNLFVGVPPRADGASSLPAAPVASGLVSDDWAAASSRLTARGLLDGSEAATASGRSLSRKIEQRADELASGPYDPDGAERIEQLLADVDPIVDRIVAAGEITFPNPMGLPAR